MAEYIEREKLIEHLKKDPLFDLVERYGITGVIEAAPAADVRLVVRGKWIWDDEGYHCSECFYHAFGETGEVLSGHWHYCPNCGADMREES